jgi:hypothetical protein
MYLFSPVSAVLNDPILVSVSSGGKNIQLVLTEEKIVLWQK